MRNSELSSGVAYSLRSSSARSQELKALLTSILSAARLTLRSVSEYCMLCTMRSAPLGTPTPSW